jgi:hypothetical protein
MPYYDPDKVITVGGTMIPHPDYLRDDARDFALLVKHAPIPVPEWEEQLDQKLALLWLAEKIWNQGESADE